MRRKLGQHFLTDTHIVARILHLAAIPAADAVLEIGPGHGILTTELARTAAQVVAIEYDPVLAEQLQHQFRHVAHVHILKGDARSIKYENVLSKYISRPQRLNVVANLPYYAAVPILKTLFRDRFLFSQGTFMFQKEVAGRITASPGSKSYGALSLLVQYYSDPYYGFLVPPRAFRPRPQVDSAVLTLHFCEHPRVHVLDEDYFFQLVKCAFLTRRKTLKNSLIKNKAALFPLHFLESAMKELHFHARIRAEELSIEDFANLCNVLLRLQRSK